MRCLILSNRKLEISKPQRFFGVIFFVLFVLCIYVALISALSFTISKDNIEDVMITSDSPDLTLDTTLKVNIEKPFYQKISNINGYIYHSTLFFTIYTQGSIFDSQTEAVIKLSDFNLDKLELSSIEKIAFIDTEESETKTLDSRLLAEKEKVVWEK